MTFTEDQMADVVVAHSTELLGEELTLLKRKAWIGRYELDLLFQDRHGAHLIVELQRGPLDRYHLYKVLDYYDEYKDRNPEAFVEIMVVANVISPARKERLATRGISFREIPEAIIASLVQPAVESVAPFQSGPEPIGDSPGSVEEADATYSLEKSVLDRLEGFRRALENVGYDNSEAGAHHDLLKSRLESTNTQLPRYQGEGDDVRYAFAFIELHQRYHVNSVRTLPIDREILANVGDCGILHADVLLYTHTGDVRHWWEHASDLARDAELPDDFLTVLTWGSQGETDLADVRTHAIEALVTQCSEDPALLQKCCRSLQSWTRWADNYYRDNPDADMGVLFTGLADLISLTCAEVLWRICLTRFKTKALAIGVDSAGSLVERQYSFPPCTASGFLDSGLTVFASTPPRPARGGRVAPGPGFGSRTSPASSARCTSA